MAKIDKLFAALETGYVSSKMTFGTVVVEDSQMETFKVRRAPGTANQSHHKLWYLSLGEKEDTNPATFYGRTFSDVLKQGLEWRGIPTKRSRKTSDNQ